MSKPLTPDRLLAFPESKLHELHTIAEGEYLVLVDKIKAPNGSYNANELELILTMMTGKLIANCAAAADANQMEKPELMYMINRQQCAANAYEELFIHGREVVPPEESNHPGVEHFDPAAPPDAVREAYENAAEQTGTSIQLPDVAGEPATGDASQNE